MKVRFRKFDASKPAVLPEYKTAGSAGLDLCSGNMQTINIRPSETYLVGTNLVIELPDGFEAQIRPRSGIAFNNSVTVLNSPGTVDSDYRGEIKVLLINHGNEDFKISYGDRIAQMVIAKYERIELSESEDLTSTERGEGGYGSTGK